MKGIFILLGIIGVAPMLEAVIGNYGVALMAILNATGIFKMQKPSLGFKLIALKN